MRTIRTADADPAAEARLVEKAASSSLQGLREECAATKAAASDPEARRRRIHAGRYLRRYRDAEGAFNLHLRDTPEVGAEMMAVLDARGDALAARARAEGREERPEAHAADALAELVREAGTGGEGDGAKPGRRWASAKILVRLDLPSLLRGYPIEGETCEIVGRVSEHAPARRAVRAEGPTACFRDEVGPVAVSAVRDMIESGDPFLAAVVTSGVEVRGIAHLGRRPTAFQRTALEWLYPRCANQACSELAALETDHRQP